METTTVKTEKFHVEERDILILCLPNGDKLIHEMDWAMHANDGNLKLAIDSGKIGICDHENFKSLYKQSLASNS